jgi:O-methyltransferase involved in polyketide biosynthesis
MEKNFPGRDYSTISPSAKSLLLLKSETDIPFAKEAAKQIAQHDTQDPDVEKDMLFWARVLHFEHRYWSIDQLLSDLEIRNILELSSGFSFRGLAMIKQKNIHYIDTDLPEIISLKKDLINELNEPQNGKGQLELLPLNALNEKQFIETTNHFSEGEVAIVNEGLLMYLNKSEKENLCAIIRNTLKERGGCWITADIYVKLEALGITHLKFNDRLEQFLREHRIEENKFESFEDAESFFKKQGFIINKKAEPDVSRLTSLNNFLQSTTPEQIEQMRKAGSMQATWRLRLAE